MMIKTITVTETAGSDGGMNRAAFSSAVNEMMKRLGKGVKMYRLLGLDMDGTVLNSRKEISPATMEAINSLIEKGIAVSLCTGRGVAELKEYAAEFAGIPYGILNSGGCVYDFRERKPVYLKLLDDEVVLECLRAAREVRAMPYLLTNDSSVAQAEDMRDVSVFHMGIYQAMYDRVVTVVPDVEEYVREHPGQSLKLCIYHRDAAAREMTRTAIIHLGMTLADAETTSLEVSPPGITKARGLQILCDYLGIPTDETVAVGDADNDLDVLRAAGLAVAMGNANQHVKEVCDVVVADNDHDGIVEVINRFF